MQKGEELPRRSHRSSSNSLSWKLCAAGSKLKSQEHVENFTADLKRMSRESGDDLFGLLEGSDVRAAEVYYHPICMQKYRRR